MKKRKYPVSWSSDHLEVRGAGATPVSWWWCNGVGTNLALFKSHSSSRFKQIPSEGHSDAVVVRLSKSLTIPDFIYRL